MLEFIISFSIFNRMGFWRTLCLQSNIEEVLSFSFSIPISYLWFYNSSSFLSSFSIYQPTAANIILWKGFLFAIFLEVSFIISPEISHYIFNLIFFRDAHKCLLQLYPEVTSLQKRFGVWAILRFHVPFLFSPED